MADPGELVFDHATIEAILPHRPPFLFVDRIVGYEPGRRIVAIKHVSVSERYLSAGTEGEPVLPLAILMETMAQVGGLLVLSGPDDRNKFAVMTTVERVRCRGAARAGEDVTIEVVLKRRFGEIGRFAGTARVAGRLIVSGRLQFALIPR
jgi:3-hydroxyacyl-[acyl-carrier-protein] dehydratase